MTRETDTVYGLATSAGHRRERNEDAALAGPDWFVVADGMGGHDGGDTASRIVVDAFAARPSHHTDAPVEAAIAAAVDAANAAIRRCAAQRGSLGMGSTVVGLTIDHTGDGSTPVVFHVGDSRCYRLVAGELRLLTRDHSHVQELIDANRLTSEQAARHPLRNVVTRAVGTDPAVAADIVRVDPSPSRFLLCSDGLSNEVGPRSVGRVLSTIVDPQAAADRLVELALAGEARDNITALVVDFEPDRPAAHGAQLVERDRRE